MRLKVSIFESWQNIQVNTIIETYKYSGLVYTNILPKVYSYMQIALETISAIRISVYMLL